MTVLRQPPLRRRAGTAAAAALVLAGIGSDVSAEISVSDGDAPVDDDLVGRTSTYLARYGQEVDSEVIAQFLDSSRSEQADALAAAGLTDPGGSLRDPDTRDYIVGQWLVQRGDVVTGNRLLLSSGLLTADEARDVLVTVDPTAWTIDPAEVALVAAARGWSEAETDARLRMQELGHYVRQVVRQQDPLLGGMWLDTADPTPLHVATAGNPGAIRDLLGESIAGDLVQVHQATYTLDELDHMAGAISDQVEEQGLFSVDEPAWVGVDERAGQVVVNPPPDASEDVETLLATPPIADWLDGGAVRLGDEGRIGPAVVMNGGEATTGCTWGFTAFSDSVDVMVTAGHCGNALPYGFITLPFRRQQVENRVDGQVNTIPSAHSGDNVVKLGSTTTTVDFRVPWADTNVGDNVCHQGMVTGFSCGDINDRFGNPTPAVPNGNHFVRVRGNDMECIPGDSGGPWYTGHSAYGLTWGCGDAPGGGVDGIYGAIDFAENALEFIVNTK